MLPEKFEERMRALLGDEYAELSCALECESVRAIRINSLKASEASADGLPTDGKIPYTDMGYYLQSGTEGIGNHPLHHAGAIYVQDPGAMASLAALPDPEALRGGRVCDLCAAPGGKTGQAAAIIGDGGFILSNEYVAKRAKILVGNLERLGARCAAVSSLDTADIAALYDSYFDLVIADAPCSGEGMFRKNSLALSEWSEENIKICAERQSYILDNAAGLVKDGGYLLYSTCTYAIEENEMQVCAFLERHPDFTLCPVNEALLPYTADGITPEGYDIDMSLTRRFYPHKAAGEGQFLALMTRRTDRAPSVRFKSFAAPLSGEEKRTVEQFLKENLNGDLSKYARKYGENIVLMLHEEPIPRGGIFSSGILLGEIRGKLVFPSHQLYSAMGTEFKRQLNITDEAIAAKYLRGEQIGAEGSKNGFTAVLYKGIPLGGGKVSGGILNNHYPKGLRLKG